MQSFRLGVAFYMLFVAVTASAEDWWQFRGPTGQGHADGENTPIQWSESQNVAWRTSLPGDGWSSPLVSGNQIWMTYAVGEIAEGKERAERLAGTTNSQPLKVLKELRMRAICLDKSTGNMLHDVLLMSKDKPQPIHILNSQASPTPVLKNGRLYCHFGANGTSCLDIASLKVLWVNQSEDLQINHENGAGSSPILWEDRLIIHFDGSDQQFIAALDTADGKIAWRTRRSGQMRENPQLRKAYGTPLVVEMGGRPTVVSPAADWVYGYDPQTGEELWQLNYGELGFSTVPRPVAKRGMVYLCTSFMKSELLAVKYDPLSPGIEPTIAWRFKKQVSQMPSPILVDDALYFVSDNGGVLTSIDANTGKLRYQERLGGKYSASPIYAGGKLYFFSREGVTHVIRPGKKYELLARNELAGSMMASPAVSDDALFLRTDKAMYRIEE